MVDQSVLRLMQGLIVWLLTQVVAVLYYLWLLMLVMQSYCIVWLLRLVRQSYCMVDQSVLRLMQGLIVWLLTQVVAVLYCMVTYLGCCSTVLYGYLCQLCWLCCHYMVRYIIHCRLLLYQLMMQGLCCMILESYHMVALIFPESCCGWYHYRAFNQSGVQLWSLIVWLVKLGRLLFQTLIVVSDQVCKFRLGLRS